MWGIEKIRNDSNLWKVYRLITPGNYLDEFAFESLMKAAEFVFEHKTENEKVSINAISHRKIIEVTSIDEVIEASLQYDGFV
jgi:hypothetical protein